MSLVVVGFALITIVAIIIILEAISDDDSPNNPT